MFSDTKVRDKENFDFHSVKQSLKSVCLILDLLSSVQPIVYYSILYIGGTLKSVSN